MCGKKFLYEHKMSVACMVNKFFFNCRRSKIVKKIIQLSINVKCHVSVDQMKMIETKL